MIFPPSLLVNAVPGGGFCRFHQHLGECGVGMHVAGNLFHTQPGGLCQRQFGQQFRNIRPHQVRPQQPAGRRIGDDLGEPGVFSRPSALPLAMKLKRPVFTSNPFSFAWASV